MKHLYSQNLKIKMMLVLLLIVALTVPFVNSKFVLTKNSYNGSISYEGYFNLCHNESSHSLPCTKNDLLKGFWKTSFPPSWILTTDKNCLGYSTNSSYVDGTCINTASFNYVTTCTCNMIIPLTCVV